MNELIQRIKEVKNLGGGNIKYGITFCIFTKRKQKLGLSMREITNIFAGEAEVFPSINIIGNSKGYSFNVSYNEAVKADVLKFLKRIASKSNLIMYLQPIRAEYIIDKDLNITYRESGGG